MRKIPTVFVRDPDDRRYVTDEVNPGCEWVLAGEGVATRKYDGTCVLLDPEGGWWARREVKHGKPAPDGWFEADCDPVTRKSVGWEPIGSSPFVKFFDEAIRSRDPRRPFVPGTYELVGPKINGNPEHADHHVLVRHATAEQVGPTGWDFPMIRQKVLALAEGDGAEGIVWHHPDGRMAKLKARDLPKAAAAA